MLANTIQPSGDEVIIEVFIEKRDRLCLAFRLDDHGEFLSARLFGAGCSELLVLMQNLRPRLKGKLKDVEIPEGTSHAVILVRELLAKAKGEWNFPFQEEEICHCRGIATSKVDQAIIGGCHTVEAVKRATSAGSSCGTCRWDVENVIKFRLAKDQAPKI